MLLRAPPTNYYLGSALSSPLCPFRSSLCVVRAIVSSAIPLGTLRVLVAFHFRNAVLGGPNCIRFAGVLARADAVREQHILFYHHTSELLLMFSLPGCAARVTSHTVFFHRPGSVSWHRKHLIKRWGQRLHRAP